MKDQKENKQKPDQPASLDSFSSAATGDIITIVNEADGTVSEVRIKGPIERYSRSIPGEAYYNVKISKPDAAKLFGLIVSLCKKTGICTASNAYLANDLNVNPPAIKRFLKILDDDEYIKRDVIRNSRKEVIRREITINPAHKEKYREMVINRIIQRKVRK